jgi:hypothetical protein
MSGACEVEEWVTEELEESIASFDRPPDAPGRSESVSLQEEEFLKLGKGLKLQMSTTLNRLLASVEETQNNQLRILRRVVSEQTRFIEASTQARPVATIQGAFTSSASSTDARIDVGAAKKQMGMPGQPLVENEQGVNHGGNEDHSQIFCPVVPTAIPAAMYVAASDSYRDLEDMSGDSDSKKFSSDSMNAEQDLPVPMSRQDSQKLCIGYGAKANPNNDSLLLRTMSTGRHRASTQITKTNSSADVFGETAQVPGEGLAPPSPAKPRSSQMRNSITAGELQLRFQSQMSFAAKSKTVMKFENNVSPIFKVVVKSWLFTIMSLGMIVANTIYIGVSTSESLTLEIGRFHGETSGGSSERENILTAFDEVFCIWFAVELTLRFVAGPSLFFIGQDFHWNVFDFFLVVMCILESVLRGFKGGNLEFLRILRVVRVIRVLRIVSLMRFFRSLRLMILSIFESMVSLLWVFILLFFFVYSFAVLIITQLIPYVQSRADNNDAITYEDEVLFEAFGGRRGSHSGYPPLLYSMVTLLQVICGGRDWKEIFQPLLVMDISMGLLFLLYIFFVVFGVLNVVTGAFVDSMRMVSERDHDHVVEVEMKRMKNLEMSMTKVFVEADTDGSNTLTWGEFETHLEDERVQAYFRSLEIDVTQARALFVLLDADGSDEVSIDSFVDGCMRMRGDAKSIDVNMLLYESHRFFVRISEFADFAEGMFEKLDSALAGIGGPEGHVATASAPAEKKRVSFSAMEMLPLQQLTSPPPIPDFESEEVRPHAPPKSGSLKRSNSTSVSARLQSKGSHAQTQRRSSKTAVASALGQPDRNTSRSLELKLPTSSRSLDLRSPDRKTSTDSPPLESSASLGSLGLEEKPKQPLPTLRKSMSSGRLSGGSNEKSWFARFIDRANDSSNDVELDTRLAPRVWTKF